MRFSLVAVVGLVFVILSGCRGCIAQHDPRADWEKFAAEQAIANKPEQTLTEDGKIPTPAPAGDAVAQDPIDAKYQQFCASCHGPQGAGDGVAGASLNPKPRNFVTWNDANSSNDEYIAKVIRDGGAAVGKSPNMAAWGGVLSAEELTGMVEKVKSFRQ